MTRDEIDQAYRTLAVIWAAIAGGVAMFGVIVWALTGPLADPSTAPPSDSTVPTILLGIAAVTIGAGVVWRRSAKLPSTGDPAARLQRYQVQGVVAWAVQDGGGLLAISAAFIASRGSWALIAAAVTVFSLVLTRPDRTEVERLLR